MNRNIESKGVSRIGRMVMNVTLPNPQDPLHRSLGLSDNDFARYLKSTFDIDVAGLSTDELVQIRKTLKVRELDEKVTEFFGNPEIDEQILSSLGYDPLSVKANIDDETLIGMLNFRVRNLYLLVTPATNQIKSDELIQLEDGALSVFSAAQNKFDKVIYATRETTLQSLRINQDRMDPNTFRQAVENFNASFKIVLEFSEQDKETVWKTVLNDIAIINDVAATIGSSRH